MTEQARRLGVTRAMYLATLGKTVRDLRAAPGDVACEALHFIIRSSESNGRREGFILGAVATAAAFCLYAVIRWALR